MDVFDQNTLVPVVVIVVCLVAAVVTHLLTREKPTSITIPDDPRGRRSSNGSRNPRQMSEVRTDPRRAVPAAYRPPGANGGAPAAAVPGSEAPVAAAAPQQDPAIALETWHRHYGASVHAWIRNHEALLDEITDGGLEIQSVSRELTQRHEQLAPIIRDAIEAHPAPEMRAQLSAMIVSSQATLHSLHRRQYDSAEHQHLTYLDYRDSWLQRLRQFETSDANSRELWDLADQQRETPGWG